MSQLLEKVTRTIQAKHFSPKTGQAYTRWIHRFILFHDKQHPKDLGGPEVTRFLSYLATDRQVAASTQNQALSAILFLYKEVLDFELPWMDGIVRAKQSIRVPTVLTKREVEKVMDRLQGPSLLVASMSMPPTVMVYNKPAGFGAGAFESPRNFAMASAGTSTRWPEAENS